MMIDGDKVLVRLEELRESAKPDPWDTQQFEGVTNECNCNVY